MDNILSLYPVKQCEHEIKDGLVVVLFRNTKPSFIEKLFFKKLVNKPYKIDLDEIGSFIWHLCDSKNNVEEIARLAKEEFGEKIDPVEERVVEFMKQMHKTKLIELYQKVS